MNMGKACVWMAVVSVVVAALWMGTGCDEGDGINGLTVTPSNVVLTGSNATAVFTASVSGQLALPLEWRVSDASLGTIQHAPDAGTGSDTRDTVTYGSNALYVAIFDGDKTNPSNGVRLLRPGANVITARDQYGNEGSAGVTQR